MCAEEKRLFYGWRMVGVAFAAHFVASGLSFYGLPRLLVPLAAEFADGERAAVALLVPAMSLPGLIVGPLVGRAIGRFPLRNVLPLGALVMGVGFMLASQVGAFWQLMCVYAIAIPIGIAAVSSIGANALVANWFDRRRAMALGAAQFGLSISGAFITFFIGWTLAHGGWRGTYMWFGGIALLAAPFLYATITNRPADRALNPDGAADAPTTSPNGENGEVMTFRSAMQDRKLWLVGMSAGLCFSGITAMLQNVHAFTTDGGHSASEADTVLATLAIGAALGKLVFGALGVRLGERRAFLLAVIGQGISLALFPSVHTSIVLLTTLALVFGLTLGGILPALAALLARLYGADQFAPVMGYIGPMLIPFQMVGAPLAAWVFDVTGSYDMAIYGFVGATAVAALAILPVKLGSDRAA